ncbi:hypothetical protein [Pseudoalteromonas sp. MB47]|uniref:hypothetical protein n=1 Tax=Pseudoalteromonas sp. MB47 TaxID=2588452 RepID=UPI00140DC3B6|nr:hypothetical protein [Pseudoalteromonas sp. MB47]NHH91320.1 hypothetical protein [Pseudoalteromonas sp. MB47]
MQLQASKLHDLELYIKELSDTDNIERQVEAAKKLDAVLKQLFTSELGDSDIEALSVIYEQINALITKVSEQKELTRNKLIELKAGNKQAKLYKLNKGYE